VHSLRQQREKESHGRKKINLLVNQLSKLGRLILFSLFDSLDKITAHRRPDRYTGRQTPVSFLPSLSLSAGKREEDGKSTQKGYLLLEERKEKENPSSFLFGFLKCSTSLSSPPSLLT